MKKRNIFTISVLIITIMVHAQQPSTEAKTLLDKTYASFQASKGIRLTFRAATLDSDDSELTAMEGTAFIKADKFRLETDQMDVWFDGSTQWVFMKEVNEVNISSPTRDEITAVSPLALLGIYRNGYILTAPVNKHINNKQVKSISMVPTVGNMEYKEVVAVIDQKSHTLVQVTLTMRNGTKQRIDISDYNANHNFSDGEFRFDKNSYPNVEIIDLR